MLECVSFDVFLNSIDGVPVDVDAVNRVLSAAGVSQPDQSVASADGWQADVYASTPQSGMMLNHISGDAGWDFVFRLAEAGPFAVMPVGVGTFVTRSELLGELHPDMPGPMAVISTGEDLLAAVRSA